MISLALAVLPAYVTFILLRLVGSTFGFDLMERATDTLINTHLPWLTPVGDVIKAHPGWAPLLAIWAAFTFTVFKAWSGRIAFFVLSGPDDSVMQPHPARAGHEGIVPWVEASGRSSVPGDPLVAPYPVRTWADQRAATQTLLAWVQRGAGDGRWRGVWPRQPSTATVPDWQPLTLALLSGANGVGKSSLVAALGARLAAGRPDGGGPDREHGFRPRMRQWRAAAGVWARGALPWLSRRADDPWDVGVLSIADDAQLAALGNWEPRRPTLLIIDEPDERAARALNRLSSRRHAFWHPVRVLMVDQVFPLALDGYLASPATEGSPAVPLEYSGALHLGEVQFDESAVRAMWTTLCEAEGRPDLTQVSRQLWQRDDVLRLLEAVGPNPLHLALALVQLADQRQTVHEMCNTACGGQASRAASHEAQLLGARAPQRELSHRLIAHRAEDLITTYETTLREHAPSLEHEVMLAIAAATVAGGLALPRDISVRLNVSVLERLFPGRRAAGGGVWIPPVRPTVVAGAFLERWIGARADPDALAADVAAFAWRHNPEGALRALHDGDHLPERLRQVLAEAAGERAQRLLWTKACCAMLLCSDGGVEPFVAALEGITTEELVELERWLEGRLAPQHPRRPEPLRVLVVVAEMAARRAVESPTGLRAADAEACVETFAHWGKLAGPTHAHRLSRRRELATSVASLLRSLVGAVELGVDARWQLVNEVLLACNDKGLEANRAAFRQLIRHARRLDGDCGGRAGEAEGTSALWARACAWLASCRAASQLGGERGVSLARVLAVKVQTIVAANLDGAVAPQWQELVASAWLHAGYAATSLGGERAPDLAEELAVQVEAITTAYPGFAVDGGLQTARALAWCHVAHAVSHADSGSAGRVQSLAGRVEAIVTARAEFAVNPELQRVSALAWLSAAVTVSRGGDEPALARARELAERIDIIITACSGSASQADLQQVRADAWANMASAVCRLGGERALELSAEFAGRVEAVVMASPDFATEVALQDLRLQACYYVAFAARQLGGERGLEQAQAMAGRVEAIVTAVPDFASHARLQDVRADVWGYAAWAAHRAGGAQEFDRTKAMAGRIEAIAMACPDFAASGRLQLARAIAWGYVANAASKLGGQRAFELARAAAGRVEAIVVACSASAVHSPLQAARAAAWLQAIHAASKLGGERAFEYAQNLAGRVEAIATASPHFAADTELQAHRAHALCNVAYAAGELDGERALDLTQALAGQVEAVVAAHPGFSTDPGLQERRAAVWCHVTRAACVLGGDRALGLAQEYASRVEAIATAQPHFASHARMQAERARAWRHVTWAAKWLGGDRGRRSAVVSASRVRDIVFARRWEEPSPFEAEWEKVQEALGPLGLRLAESGQLEFVPLS